MTNGIVFFHLFNVSHFSSLCCVKNSSFIGCPTTMAKRTKESDEGKIVAKSKPTVLKLSSCDSVSSSSICKRSKNIERPGDPLRLTGNLSPRKSTKSRVLQGRLNDVSLCGLKDKAFGETRCFSKRMPGVVENS